MASSSFDSAAAAGSSGGSEGPISKPASAQKAEAKATNPKRAPGKARRTISEMAATLVLFLDNYFLARLHVCAFSFCSNLGHAVVW